MPPELLYYPYNPELLYYPYNPSILPLQPFYITPTTLLYYPNNVLLMANVMSFHHTATLLRGGGGIFCYLQVFNVFWEIFECSKSLVIDLIALYAKF